MRQLTLIGWYLVALFPLGSLLMGVGCCPKTYERIVKDTVTVTRLDTVLVNLRPVDIDVPVPQITLTEIVPISDTLLTLDNGLYASEVLIKDGQVTHKLRPSDGADSLHTTVMVADTTRVSNVSTSSVHQERELVFIKDDEPWYTRLWHKVSSALTWIVVGVILFVVVLLAVRRWVIRVK